MVGSRWNQNPSKFLWISLFPARMKKIQSKMKLVSLWGFFRYSRTANSAVHVWIWLMLLLMVQSGFPRYLQEWRRSNQKWRRYSVYNVMHSFLDAQGHLNTVVSGWISLKSKPIQVLCMSLFHARMKKIQSKMKLVSLWGFFFQIVKGSWLCSASLDLAEIRTHPRRHGCPCHLQE